MDLDLERLCAPAPQDAKAGLSVVAKAPRAECAVDLPCAAGRLAIPGVPDMLKTPSARALTDHRQAARPPSVSTRQVACPSLESIIVGREPSLDQA
jgi:hypothetical protein